MTEGNTSPHTIARKRKAIDSELVLRREGETQLQPGAHTIAKKMPSNPGTWEGPCLFKQVGSCLSYAVNAVRPLPTAIYSGLYNLVTRVTTVNTFTHISHRVINVARPIPTIAVETRRRSNDNGGLQVKRSKHLANTFTRTTDTVDNTATQISTVIPTMIPSVAPIEAPTESPLEAPTVDVEIPHSSNHGDDFTVKRFKRLPGHTVSSKSDDRYTLPIDYLNSLPDQDKITWTNSVQSYLGSENLQATVEFLEALHRDIRNGHILWYETESDPISPEDVMVTISNTRKSTYNIGLSIIIHNWMFKEFPDGNTEQNWKRSLDAVSYGIGRTLMQMVHFYDENAVKHFIALGLKPTDSLKLPYATTHISLIERLPYIQIVEFIHWVLEHCQAFDQQTFPKQTLGGILVDFDSLHKEQLVPSFLDWPGKNQQMPGAWPENTVSDLLFDNVDIKGLAPLRLWDFRHPELKQSKSHPNDDGMDTTPPGATPICKNEIFFDKGIAYPMKGILKNAALKRLDNAMAPKKCHFPPSPVAFYKPHLNTPAKPPPIQSPVRIERNRKRILSKIMKSKDAPVSEDDGKWQGDIFDGERISNRAIPPKSPKKTITLDEFFETHQSPPDPKLSFTLFAQAGYKEPEVQHQSHATPPTSTSPPTGPIVQHDTQEAVPATDTVVTEEVRPVSDYKETNPVSNIEETNPVIDDEIDDEERNPVSGDVETKSVFDDAKVDESDEPKTIRTSGMEFTRLLAHFPHLNRQRPSLPNPFEESFLGADFPQLRISPFKADELAVERQLREDAQYQHEREIAAEQQRKEVEKRRKAEEELTERNGGLRQAHHPVVPALSAEWTTKVTNTLRARPDAELAMTPEGIPLTKKDFAQVVPRNVWLNDEIVNSTLIHAGTYVNDKAGITNTRAQTPKMQVFNSFFGLKIAQNGAEGMDRFMRRQGIKKETFLNIETVLIPMCRGKHWTLIVVRPGRRSVSHIDSMNRTGGSRDLTTKTLKWVKTVLGDKFIEAEWKTEHIESPQQINCDDCGVHTITNGICIGLGIHPASSYKPADMPLQRHRIAAVCLNGGFNHELSLDGI